MTINYDAVNKFVLKNGNVQMFNPDGGFTTLKSGDIDRHAAFEKATKFVHRGITYTREQFDKLLSEA